MHRAVWLSLFFILGSGAALGQAKKPLTEAEMKALLGKGLLVTSSDLQGGREFTGRIQLAANGNLSGTITPAGHQAIALAGKWRLAGGRLCRTLAPIQPEEICETWLRTGPKEAIVQVGGKETSVNRWQ